MNRSHWKAWVLTNGIMSALLCASPIAAQVVPDATLPAGERSQVTGDPNVQIDGGARRGGNLFHSFSQFSIPTGGSASFNNAADVQNIFSRVTGGSASNIDGLIRANGTANLFLLNPNGIIFGPNARLDIGGSFVSSTASSIQFMDGTEFSTVNPSAPSLLTVSVPMGLQFNGRQGDIVMQMAPLDSQTSLQVQPGRTLALIGGNINLQKGYLQAIGGRVELGGVTGSGMVGLNGNGNPLNLSFPNQLARADVSLNGSDIDVTGANGSMRIIARNINISDSRLQMGIPVGLRLPDTRTGELELNATGSITLQNRSSLENSLAGQGTLGRINLVAGDRVSLNRSSVNSIVQPTGMGNAGGINFTTGSLSLTNNAQLLLKTGGQGNSGPININARDTIFVSDISGISNTVETTGIGNTGDININTGSLSFKGGTLLSASEGRGNSSTVNIHARDTISLDESFLATSVLLPGVGNAGDINITTDSLSLTGGFLSSSGVRQGNSGNITINARDTVSLIQDAALGTTAFAPQISGNVSIRAGNRVSLDGGSRITTALRGSSFPSGSIQIARAGDIDITTGVLSLTHGSILESTTDASTTFGQGNAGSVNINAYDRVIIDGESDLLFGLFRSTSVISTQVLSESTQEADRGAGQGGAVSITTGSLFLTNGGSINTSTQGQGNAGRVTINARDSVQIRGTAPSYLSYSPLFSSSFYSAYSGVTTSAQTDSVGDGGNVSIATRSLSVSDSGRISTTAQGQGRAGNIQIRAIDTVSFNGSDAISTLERGAVGRGGDIAVEARSLSLLNGSQLATSTRGQGDAGNVTINARDTVALTGSDRTSPSAITTQVEAGAAGTGGQINITTGSASLTRGAQLVTTTSSQGRAGNISINARDRVTVSGTDSSYGDRVPPTDDDEASVINAGSASGLFANTEVNSTGEGGDIRIATGQLTVEAGGRLVASTAGQSNAGNIRVRATNGLTLSGTSPNGSSSGLLTNTESTSTGRGGEIRVDTAALQVNRGAVLSARSSSTARGGEIIVNADTVDLTRGGQLLTTAFSSGQAGNITVNASDRLRIAGSDPTFAARLEQFGRPTVDPVNAASGFFTNTEASSSGAGGAIALTTGSLSLLDSGRLVASTAGRGDAGDITVNSSNLSLSGASSGLFAQTSTTADAGNLTIQPQGNSQRVTVQLQEGAQISASTTNSGRGGRLTITAPDFVTLTGNGSIISAETSGRGTGGNLNLRTGTLNIQDQAEVTVSSLGSGTAGNLFVDANRIFLDNGGGIRADTAGGGGNIDLRSPLILLRNGSNITTNATGRNIPGGNININTEFLVAVSNEDSNISANSEDFRGGNVSIDAIALYGIQPSLASTPFSDITATGATTALPGTIDVTTAGIDPTSGLVALPTDIVDASQLIAQGCPANEGNSFVITGRGGLPPTPAQELDDAAEWDDRSILTVPQQTHETEVRNLAASTRAEDSSPRGASSTTAPSIIEATNWQRAATGEVILVADTPELTVQNSLHQSLACHGRP